MTCRRMVYSWSGSTRRGVSMMAAAAMTCCCCPTTACLSCSNHEFASGDLLSAGTVGTAGTAGCADAVKRVPTNLRGLMAGSMFVTRCIHEREAIAGSLIGFAVLTGAGCEGRGVFHLKLFIDGSFSDVFLV